MISDQTSGIVVFPGTKRVKASKLPHGKKGFSPDAINLIYHINFCEPGTASIKLSSHLEIGSIDRMISLVLKRTEDSVLNMIDITFVQSPSKVDSHSQTFSKGLFFQKEM